MDCRLIPLASTWSRCPSPTTSGRSIPSRSHQVPPPSTWRPTDQPPASAGWAALHNCCAHGDSNARGVARGTPRTAVSPEQVIKAKKLVKALRINFDSRSFENPCTLPPHDTRLTSPFRNRGRPCRQPWCRHCRNPTQPASWWWCLVQTALQRHYANLQALALDRDTVEETPDYLLPDTEGMENVCPSPIALTPLSPRVLEAGGSSCARARPMHRAVQSRALLWGGGQTRVLRRGPRQQPRPSPHRHAHCCVLLLTTSFLPPLSSSLR